MEDPQSDIQKILAHMLDLSGSDRSGSDALESALLRQKEAIRRHAASDVEFIHPGAHTKGLERYMQVYEFWTRQNWANRSKVNVTAWNKETGLLVVDVQQTFHHKYRAFLVSTLPLGLFTALIGWFCLTWPFLIPLLVLVWLFWSPLPFIAGVGLFVLFNRPTSVRTIAFVWCVKGQDGKWRISKQEDFYPAERLADAVLNAGGLYQMLVQVPGGLVWTELFLRLERRADALAAGLMGLFW